VSADTLALVRRSNVVLWSDRAFMDRHWRYWTAWRSVIRQKVAAIVRAVYEIVMPAVAQDADHALRIATRAGK
jgi:hypothetical protein